MYYDSRHQVIKTSFIGGGHGKLIKELQPDGSYRDLNVLLAKIIVKRLSPAT